MKTSKQLSVNSDRLSVSSGQYVKAIGAIVEGFARGVPFVGTSHNHVGVFFPLRSSSSTLRLILISKPEHQRHRACYGQPSYLLEPWD